MKRESRRRRWRRAVRAAQGLGGHVLRGPRWDAAGAVRAMPDAELAALVRALPDDGAQAIGELVFALRDVRSRKGGKRGSR